MNSRIDRSALGWGTAFLALGAGLAARQLGILAPRLSVWSLALLAVGLVLGLHALASGTRQWAVPTVFVLIGGTLVLRDIGTLATVPILPIVLVAAGVAVLANGFSSRSPTAEQASLALDSAASARLTIDHGAGSVRLHGGATPGRLVEGTFDGGVIHELERNGAHFDVRLRPATDRLWGRSRGLDWDIALTEEVPVALRLRTGAGQLSLDCSNLLVPRLELSTGASDVDVQLPAHGHTSVKITAGAADVRVHVPPGVAAEVRDRTGLAGVRIDQGRFPQHNGAYRSPDFNSAEDRVEIDLEGGVASFSVD